MAINITPTIPSAIDMILKAPIGQWASIGSMTVLLLVGLILLCIFSPFCSCCCPWCKNKKSKKVVKYDPESDQVEGVGSDEVLEEIDATVVTEVVSSDPTSDDVTEVVVEAQVETESDPDEIPETSPLTSTE
ncbi:hypothetical protein [Carp edema virus]|nr:hypothetical protein [Carp edema virus]